MTAKQRKYREYQAKSRGDRISYKTELENVQILLAYEASDLSEGQASNVLGVGRIEFRKMLSDARTAGYVLANELLGKGDANDR